MAGFKLMKISRRKGEYVGDWYWSEKLDGQRAFWDGGVSRGMPVEKVPWAGDGVRNIGRLSTGLWSSRGGIIAAPDWWLDLLPKRMLLDGELWMGVGTWGSLRSIVSRLDGSEAGWEKVGYWIFDRPSGVHFGIENCEPGVWFNGTIEVPENQVVRAVVQHLGPVSVDLGPESGIEGIVYRKGGTAWSPRRVPWCLKEVGVWYDVGEVIGYKEGTGRLKGKIGSLEVRAWIDGVCSCFRVNIRGDKFREPRFWPLGRTVRFEYMELTEDGKPRNPRLVDGESGLGPECS